MSNAFFDALRAQEECRDRLAVTLPDYQQAVKTLLPIALSDTSGGRVAANLLLQRSDKVAAIAAEVGYDSEAAFSRAFKKAAGLAPRAWRERRGNNAANNLPRPPRTAK